MVNNRPSGLRPGSEADVIVDGNQCESEGMGFPQSANGAAVDEGFDGRIRRKYNSQVYQLRGGGILYTRTGGWIEENGREMEDGRKRPPSAGSSISAHIRVRKNEEEASGPNRGQETEYRAAQPCDRKRGVVNEDPYGGNVRAKVNLDAEEEMVRAQSPADRFGTGDVLKSAKTVKSETSERAMDEPPITGPAEGHPRRWQDGFRPTMAKEEQKEGLEEAPHVTSDGENELRLFGEEVAPPSTFENAPLAGNTEQDEDAMSDWFYEDVRTSPSEQNGEHGRKTTERRCEPDVPVPEPVMIDVSDDDSRSEMAEKPKVEKGKSQTRPHLW